MHIINSLADIRGLHARKVISSVLAIHLCRKCIALYKALEPQADIHDFSLELHGQIGILTKEDEGLTAFGLPEQLNCIMPEWISKLQLGGELYFVLYIMANNDCVIQIYLPDEIMADKVRAWLMEQPMEDEAGDESYDFEPEPF